MLKKIIILFLISAGLVFLNPVQSQKQNVTVIKIIDGDSFIVNSSEGELEIRLNGIDCPEFDQDFGKEAKSLTEELLFKRITISASGLDKYGRILADVWYNDVWYNELLVANGYAWHYTKYSDDAELARAETKAKTLRLGIWKSDNPIPPWEWRSGNGASSYSKVQQTSNTPGNLQNNRQINVKETSASEVVICGGQYAKRYHSSANCRGLNNCRGEISTVTLKEAQGKGRTPCLICY